MPFTLGPEGGKKRQDAIEKGSPAGREKKNDIPSVLFLPAAIPSTPSDGTLHFHLSICVSGALWNTAARFRWEKVVRNSRMPKNAARDNVSLRKYSRQDAMHRIADFNLYRIACLCLLNSGIRSRDIFATLIMFLFI